MLAEKDVVGTVIHKFYATTSQASGLIACPTPRSQASSICRDVAAFRDAVVVRDAGIGLPKIITDAPIITDVLRVKIINY